MMPFHPPVAARMLHLRSALLLLLLTCRTVAGFTASSNQTPSSSSTQQRQLHGLHSCLFSTTDSSAAAFDQAVMNRYACTRFQPSAIDDESSSANETIVNLALESLDLARRAPSGFNAQPYKMVLIQSANAKAAIARHCAGRNADRVRDSDCTVIFLADKEVGRTMGRFRSFLTSTGKWKKGRQLTKLQAIIGLFSSGYPLPRILAAPLSFGVRTGVSVVNLLFGRFGLVVPTLGGAETWASKNTMLVAMTYMLGCSSRGIDTCPMEGVNGPGIRRALKIPRRYGVPLIVATGVAYAAEESDDVGMGHGGPDSIEVTNRYPRDEMIFKDAFGTPF